MGLEDNRSLANDEPGRGLYRVEGISIIGNLDDISGIIKKNAIDEVVFIVPRSRLGCIEPGVLACETMGVKARVAMDLFNLKIAKARHADLDGLPFASFETTVGDEFQLLIKRTLDIVLSSLGMIALLPLALIVTASLKLLRPVRSCLNNVGLDSTAENSYCISSEQCVKARMGLGSN